MFLDYANVHHCSLIFLDVLMYIIFIGNNRNTFSYTVPAAQNKLHECVVLN